MCKNYRTFGLFKWHCSYRVFFFFFFLLQSFICTFFFLFSYIYSTSALCTQRNSLCSTIAATVLWFHESIRSFYIKKKEHKSMIEKKMNSNIEQTKSTVAVTHSSNKCHNIFTKHLFSVVVSHSFIFYYFIFTL